jgi:hypothetical protein
MKSIKMWAITFLFVLAALPAWAEELKTATVTGRVAAKSGAPMSDAYIYMFNDALGPPPNQYKYWRLPDEIIQADQNGRFSAQVPYGTYFLGAIKRVNGQDIGPPTAGDIFLDSALENGQPRKYLFNRDTIDIGLIDQGEPFKLPANAISEGVTAIEGKVVNADGKPATGVSVFAFTSPNMVGRPLFSSERTGSDGTFLLRVAKGGAYFLKAREGYGGGPPKLGGLIGYYGEHAATPISVTSGNIVKGIKVVVSPLAGQGSRPIQGKHPAAGMTGTK